MSRVTWKKSAAIKLACTWYVQCINYTTQQSSSPFQGTDSQMPNSGNHSRLWSKRYPLMLVCYLESRSWPRICIIEGMEVIRIKYSDNLCSALLTSLWRWLYKNNLVPKVSEWVLSAGQNSKDLLFEYRADKTQIYSCCYRAFITESKPTMSTRKIYREHLLTHKHKGWYTFIILLSFAY